MLVCLNWFNLTNRTLSNCKNKKNIANNLIYRIEFKESSTLPAIKQYKKFLYITT
jgi:hypothetical protein